MERDAAVYFLNQLRQARYAVLRDAEAVDALIHVFERMGMFLLGNIGDLGHYQGVLGGLAGRSPLAREMERTLHIPFNKLFESVREARNSAMHEGAYARHLASHAVKLALVLEDALMNDLDRSGETMASNLRLKDALMNEIGDLMVSHPVCAEMWQPLSFIRQTMLENSFSFLPVKMTTGATSSWKLVCDLEVARYLHAAGTTEERKQRLLEPLKDAVQKTDALQLQDTIPCQANGCFRTLLRDRKALPILVVREGAAELLGIVTAFDLL
jgi:CBS domain-containing protein